MAIEHRVTNPINAKHPQELFADQFFGPAWPDSFGNWLAGWSAKTVSPPLKTLSLFTGAGGLDIGFHQAGFHAAEMVEYDSRFVPTLQANAGIHGLFQGCLPRQIDVRDYSADDLGDIDFIIGGPPCQTFSAAARRAGGVRGTSDDRGQLFLTYVKLLKQLKPAGFLFENVYGITGANGGNDWQDICRAFREAGYQIFHRVLDSADYGVPQHRERMFIVGLQHGAFRFPRPTHGPDSATDLPYYQASLAIRGAPVIERAAPSEVNGRYGHLLREVPPGLNYSYFTERMGHPQPIFAWRSKFSDFLYKADPGRPVRTIKAQGGQYTGPFHWDNRPFTTAEFKRLQTFPDDYHIVGGRSTVIHQIGNSVPPQIARILALSILEQVFNVRSPLTLQWLAADETLGFRSRKRQLTKRYEHTAQIHLQKRAAHQVERIQPWSSCVTLADGFRLSEKLDGASDAYTVHAQPFKKKWRFIVAAANETPKPGGFSICVQPRKNGDWPLPFDEIELKGSALNPAIFTLAWKALECDLQRYKLKADLVQLSGYYQYESAFTARMEVHGRATWKWRALARVVNGHGIRRTLPAQAIAQEWGIKSERLPEFGHFLRSLGMEVRNHHTNSQIPSGQWMLPYAFPSLNHQSVQLKKRVGL